jgi:stalled ribosome rescue protein Dom34
MLFADDMSIIISNSNQEEFKTNINSVMNEIMNWFQSNLLTMKRKKTHFLQFLTKNKKELQIQIVSSNSIISNLKSATFLGLTIDSTLSWKDHIADLTSKLNKACYAIRTIKPFMNFNVLRTIYFSYFYSVMSYGIIFWGNSHHSVNIFCWEP